MGDIVDTLYDFPADYVGRKSYVSVRGHSKSVPKYKTYRGTDGYNYILPAFGGDYSGLGVRGPTVVRDKSAYYSVLDNTVVDGYAAHREHMKRHGVIEAGDMKLGEFKGHENSPMPSAGHDIIRAMQELSR